MIREPPLRISQNCLARHRCVVDALGYAPTVLTPIEVRTPRFRHGRGADRPLHLLPGSRLRADRVPFPMHSLRGLPGLQRLCVTVAISWEKSPGRAASPTRAALSADEADRPTCPFDTSHSAASAQRAHERRVPARYWADQERRCWGTSRALYAPRAGNPSCPALPRARVVPKSGASCVLIRARRPVQRRMPRRVVVLVRSKLA